MTFPTKDRRADAIVAEVSRLRAEGHRSIGIYAKTNNDAASLCYALAERGLEHVPIGFSEAYGEALSTMLVMVQYAVGVVSWADVRIALGITLTANARTPSPPQLAIALRDGRGYPDTFEQRLFALAESLDAAGDDVNLAVNTAVGSWRALGFLNGQRSWLRAGRTFSSAMARAQLGDAPNLDRLSASAAAIRDASFLELDAATPERSS